MLKIEEWLEQLEKDEQGYIRRSYRLLKQGHRMPADPPEGISKAKADILWHHMLSLTEEKDNRRKVNSLVSVSFRMPYSEYKKMVQDASEVDINHSVFIRSCIALASGAIRKNPNLIYVLHSVIPK